MHSGAVHDAAYHLVTRWHLPAPRVACWAVLAEPSLSWPRWWPGLEGEVAEPDRSARLTYRTGLGYRLGMVLRVEARCAPSSARFSVRGDLVGDAVVVLRDAPGPGGAAGTELTLRWDVRTRRPWMNVLAPAARPAFAWAHARVMADGARGLAAHLAALPGTM